MTLPARHRSYKKPVLQDWAKTSVSLSRLANLEFPIFTALRRAIDGQLIPGLLGSGHSAQTRGDVASISGHHTVGLLAESAWDRHGPGGCRFDLMMKPCMRV